MISAVFASPVIREGFGKLWRLPKVSSSYPLSPQRGERVRVRGDKKRLLATSICGTEPDYLP
jgi:hypothetical protein